MNNKSAVQLGIFSEFLVLIYSIFRILPYAGCIKAAWLCPISYIHLPYNFVNIYPVFADFYIFLVIAGLAVLILLKKMSFKWLLVQVLLLAIVTLCVKTVVPFE